MLVPGKGEIGLGGGRRPVEGARAGQKRSRGLMLPGYPAKGERLEEAKGPSPGAGEKEKQASTSGPPGATENWRSSGLQGGCYPS